MRLLSMHFHFLSMMFLLYVYCESKTPVYNNPKKTRSVASNKIVTFFSKKEKEKKLRLNKILIDCAAFEGNPIICPI